LGRLGIYKQRLTCFDVVWQTVGEKYFDSTFGGLDWNKAYDRYQPQIAAAPNDSSFYELINKMLLELNVSHMCVIPPDKKNLIEPILSADGSVGIDLRLIDEKVVITAVEQGSAGESAGLHPGFFILEINGRTIQQIASEVEFRPPFNDRNKRQLITSRIQEHVYGPTGTTTRLIYQNGSKEVHEAEIRLTPRGNKVILDETLPPCFIDFNFRLLEDGDIGYIRFNAFMPPVQERFAEALSGLINPRALIIDIRGNHGGVWPIRKLLAEQLVSDPVLFWRYRSRQAIKEVYLNPIKNAYVGLLAVIVDELSKSSAEEFAGAIQAIHRGIVVGNRTPGNCVVCDFLKLPNDAILVFPVLQTITSNGTVLEGHGVIPDVEVALTRAQLLQGNDSQLMAAIRHLKMDKQGVHHRKD
jgi:carboxyl-terminal processing protease